jgi:hypothetical protein
MSAGSVKVFSDHSLFLDFEDAFRAPMMTHALLSWHSFLRWPSRSSKIWMSSHLPTSFNPSRVHPVLNHTSSTQDLSQSPELARRQTRTQMPGLCQCRLIQDSMEKRLPIWQLQPAAGLIACPPPPRTGARVSSCSNRMISLLLLVINFRTPSLPLAPH